MGKMINIGMIGYGLAGRVFHAPMIDCVEGLNLHKVYVTNEENIKKLKVSFKDAIVAASTDEVLQDENIELVVIATPNTSHYCLAKKALENGKHVVLEKPFTIDVKEADALIELARAKKVLLTVHHNRRWDSDFLTVKKIVQSGLLGDIAEYEAHFDRFRPELKVSAWKETNDPGSGILYDLGSHLIDQALCLFGMPEEVFADLRIQRNGSEIVDNFEVILNYNNLKVTLKSGMLVKEAGPHFKLLGNRGSFTKHGMDVQENDLKNGIFPKHNADWGKEPESLWGTINTEIESLSVIGKVESEIGDYTRFYKNVYQTIIGNELPLVKPIEARNTIKIIELAEKSNSERKWVKFQV
ncbi:MAG: Gfo/Idh/MocA family oxidoreductase [Proteocatella sp.]